MALFLTVFAVMLLVVSAMAIGVMFGRKPISGSCGGIGNTGVASGPCAFCGGNPTACESPELIAQPQEPSQQSLPRP